MQNEKAMQRIEKELFWKNHVVAWKKSGFSKQQYCTQHDLKKSTFAYWARKLAPTIKNTGFIRVPSFPSKQAQCIEVIIDEKLRIRISEGFEPELLIKVLKTLEQAR